MRHLCILAALAPASAAPGAVDFAADVQPILAEHCFKCHREGYKKTEQKLETRSSALEGDFIVPGRPDESDFIARLELAADDGDIMPPAKEGPPLSAEKIGILRSWVAAGAPWPEEIVLSMEPEVEVDFERDIRPILDRLSEEERAKVKAWVESGGGWPAAAGEDAALELSKRLHAKITATTGTAEATAMAPYKATVPATGAAFEMVPVPAGEFTMGSPESEKGRGANEGPPRKVEVAPFWIGKHEVTWDEYESFMVDGGRRNKDGSKKFPDPGDSDVDIVSRPTKPYVEMTFGMGKEGYPAISMTQHTALTYCKWLSAQTGHFYRLPTEAEWEYACRAGTDTAYSFGDDPAELHKYGWFFDNANFAYQKVGKKAPNPWGIHDMHGNVAEWTLDSLSEDGYTGAGTDNPWARGRQLYPRAVRGGSWNDFPEGLRSAARVGSSGKWKVQDPQLPKSIWYHTDAQWLGFRIVRPLEVPPVEEMHAIWNAGIDHDTLE